MNGENLISILEICEKSELNYFKYRVKGEELSFQKGIFKDNNDNESMKFEYQGAATKESIEEKVLISKTLDFIDSDQKASTEKQTEVVILKSNFVGAFSTSESLKAGNYTVKKGDVLGAVEAMKVYNDVVAPVSGTVEEIVAADGSLVECDQDLITIRVSG